MKVILLHALKLIVPVLIPSWNFFDVIVPSPRVEYVITKNRSKSAQWHEYKPRPEKLSLRELVQRMFWNAQWNESLFLMSCAERLLDYPTKHSEEEIFKRLIVQLGLHVAESKNKYIQFRLVFIRRENDKLVEEIRYKSEHRLIQSTSLI